MVAYIDIDKLCWEMEELYKQEKDIEKVKEIMRESFEKCLTDNEDDIVSDYEIKTDENYYIFINGEISKYKNKDKELLQIELDDLIAHEDNKEWIKDKSFEIKKRSQK